MDPHHRRHSIGSSTGSLSDDLLFSGSAHTAAPPLSSFFPYGVPHAAAAGDHSYASSEDTESGLALGPSTSGSRPPNGPPALVPLSTPHTPQTNAGAGAGAGGGRSPVPGRSRARAFSFLSTHDAAAAVYGERHDAAGLTPRSHSGATPFVGRAYESALDGAYGAEDEDADEVDVLGGARGGGGGGGGESSEDEDDDDDEGRGALEMREVRGRDGAAAGKARTGGYRTRFEPLEGYELAWMGVSAASVLGLTVAAVVLAFVG
ncbi:hypothetical protein DMC30DRAFT_201280 [Rhodotorula diobovata]|uniref:Uncharacterized protein n=1 Tax=Rhodotorula diobovata TaxID=5288 RepID=A0A5C5FYU0_9BASI|nr:hypothetical protein DMC30DRAFT_201280 [Rhodotorula diobovata]